ncbi:MAG: trimethylamine methyltransferase family protein [Proteobacteria bacterium]|nr:trimethylamine methyltransferase family protein [Pseudomonadota bacterium]
MGLSTRTNLAESASPQFALLSEDQKEDIYHGILRTLRNTGANVNHDEAREILGKAGCLVEGNRVRIPPEIVRDALQSLPQFCEIHCWDGNLDKKIFIQPNRSYFGPGPTPPNFIDPDTLERRPYLRKDAATVARVCDALPNIGYAQSLGSINDVTNGLADVYEFADMIQNTTTPIMNWAFGAAGAAEQHRIGVIMAGGEDAFRRKPNYIHYGEPISPLISDFHAVDKCLYNAKRRIPQVYSPCSIGGGTAPASHAGQIIVGLCDAMVGVVLSQLTSPGTCIIVGGVQSILDMRETIYSYGAPELSLLSAATTEICRFMGLPMYSTSGCTDTKRMDIQSAIEAALSINMAMLSGANFVHDNGYTESGMTGDVFQLVMDDELIGMARFIERGILVNEETMAVDVINSVGPGGHYLYEDHTMKWFRSHYMPTLMERNSYENWEAAGKLTMKDRVIAKTRDIIENHEGPIAKVPAGVKKEIEGVLASAEERVRSQAKKSV